MVGEARNRSVIGRSHSAKIKKKRKTIGSCAAWQILSRISNAGGCQTCMICGLEAGRHFYGAVNGVLALSMMVSVVLI